jgi:uncharacterized membrane protein YqiK
MAQKKRQELVRETAAGEAARLNASGEGDCLKLRASGEAESIRATGDARAEAYLAGVNALGPEAYMALQLMQVVGERGVRIVLDVAVNGGTSGQSGLVDGLLGMMMKNAEKKKSTG